MNRIFSISLILIFLFPSYPFCSENPPLPPFSKGGRGDAQLPKTYIQKLKRIAEIIAAEIIRKDIKTVRVEDFTDFKGNPSNRGKMFSSELQKQLSSAGEKYFSIVSNGANAIVRGTLVPFKGKKKMRLDIKVVSSDTGKIITSYTAIFKESLN